jgi:hypothetical protein
MVTQDCDFSIGLVVSIQLLLKSGVAKLLLIKEALERD